MAAHGLSGVVAAFISAVVGSASSQISLLAFPSAPPFSFSRPLSPAGRGFVTYVCLGLEWVGEQRGDAADCPYHAPASSQSDNAAAVTVDSCRVNHEARIEQVFAREPSARTPWGD